MIHMRNTLQIAPGRQADAVARAHQFAAIFKQASGVDMRVSVVTSGTLGRLCLSADYDSMSAREAAVAKSNAHPDWIALTAKQDQEVRDGTDPIVPNTNHIELWRDA